MEKMKAAVMYGPSNVVVEQIDKPKCPEDGFLLKVEAVGLCGSDIRNLTTDSRKGKYPWVYGHEHAGTVVELGQNVKKDFSEKFKIGDRVYVSPVVTDPKATASTGGFAEYMAITGWSIDHVNVLPMPDDVKFENIIMAEPLSSVYACQEAIDVKIGQTVVILGAGPIGCLHSELAKLRGASKVIMAEINENRLKMSLNFGVDETINSKKVDPIEAVKKLTDGQGADQVICANPVPLTQQQAIYMAKSASMFGTPGGTVTFFGGLPKGTLVELDTNHIHYSGLWIYGAFGFRLPQNVEAFKLICSGQFKAEKYISKVMPLDDIMEAVKMAKAGEVIKISLIP